MHPTSRGYPIHRKKSGRGHQSNERIFDQIKRGGEKHMKCYEKHGCPITNRPSNDTCCYNCRVECFYNMNCPTISECKEILNVIMFIINRISVSIENFNLVCKALKANIEALKEVVKEK